MKATTTSNVRRFATAMTVTAGLSLTPLPAAADPIGEMLAAKALEGAYNPVLLGYLLEEGVDALPAAQRQQALDQLVAALKRDIEITPEEQRAAALATAAAATAQLFGGDTTRELGDVAQDATYQIWKGWVDSASVLLRAGYAEDANAFFEQCIEIYPYTDLRGRCAIGLAAGKPDEAFERLMALTDGDNETAKAALRALGEMAGSEGFPEERRTVVVERLGDFTKGMRKATFGLAACQGLVATGDPRAVPILQGMAQGMMNTDLFPCARRGLLLTFGDTSVVPLLERQLAGGALDTTKPHEKIFAAELLMLAGEDAGFQFAEAELTRPPVSGARRLLKTSRDQVDLRPALVTTLRRVGGERSIAVLRQGMEATEQGSWLEIWTAIALTELGDAAHLDLVRRAMGQPDWAFTTVRIATALGRHGDFSGIAHLEALYRQAAAGVEPDVAAAVLAVLAGAGERHAAGREAKERRLIRLREQVAGALADLDRPDSVPVLTLMLEDKEPTVRTAAAYALARMSDPAAATGIGAALGVSYGTAGKASRDPLVHAQLVRSGALRVAEGPGWDEALGKARESSFASVRFLALSAASTR